MSLISRIQNTAVPAVKEAVPQSAPAKPNPVTTGTIPSNVTEGLAKAAAALVLPHFPGAGADTATAGAPVVGAAGLQNQAAGQPTLDRQVAVSRLDAAEALVQDAFARVGKPNATAEDKRLAQREMQEAAEIRRAVADTLPGLITGGFAPAMQQWISDANAREQQAFSERQSKTGIGQIRAEADLNDAAAQFQFIDRSILLGRPELPNVPVPTPPPNNWE